MIRVPAADAMRARLRGVPGAAAPEPPPADGVVPTLAELIALRGLAHARGRVRRGASGLRAQAPSVLRGRGMEYAESRPYAVGDDARHIDWRLTARSGKAHTKLFQAERERLTLVVADTSPALYFGTRCRFKSVQAARAGAVAAWRAVADGDRVAALRGSAAAPPVPAASGARGALRVLDALARWYARPPGDDAGLEVALDHAARLLRPGSRLLVLADPASVETVPAARWPALAAHHQVVVLLLTDPLELDPPEDLLAFEPGPATPAAARPGSHVQDTAIAAGRGGRGLDTMPDGPGGVGRGDGAGASSPRRIELDLAAPAQRARWREAFAGQLSATVAALEARGVRALPLSSDAPSDAWLAAAGAGRG